MHCGLFLWGKMSETKNAKEFPKFYYARHMKDGVCGYGEETILIQDDAIKSMMKSFNGKPVYILHDERSCEERLVDIKTAPVGYVTDSFYNEKDGWFWCKFMVIDDEGHEKVNAGWSVSNAYIPSQVGNAGTKHNVPYNREFLNGDFTHLAIVPNPRYEDAKIFTPEQFKAYQDEKNQQLNELKNSKTEEKKGLIMNFFKMKKEEVSKVDADCFVEITNDDGTVSEIAVKDMVDTILNAKKEDEKETMNMDDEVEVGDEKMSLKELINKYQEMKTPKDEKSNECDEVEDKKDEEEKANAVDESESVVEEELTNANEDDADKVDHFEELKNAESASYGKMAVELGMDKVARGDERY